MDNKITKSRLSNLLSYDWLKIIALIVAVAVVWSLAFTIGAPRASVGQTFGLFTYTYDFASAIGEGELLADARKNGAFSYDVLDFNTRRLDNEYYSTIMSAADSVQEGDIFITSDLQSAIEKNESPFRSFIDGYFSKVYDLESLISDAKKYATENGIVFSDGKYSVDEKRVGEVFADRMKNDPRFRNKNSQKYADGLKNETERIKAVWNNACKLEAVIVNHPEILVSYRPFTQRLNTIDEEKRADDNYYKYWQEAEEKPYAINLGKLKGGSVNVTDIYSYDIEKDNGEVELSADGVVLCVFNYKSAQPHLQYETLGYINYMIGLCSDYMNVMPSSLVE